MYNDKRFLMVVALATGAVCGYLHATTPGAPVASNATSAWDTAWSTATASSNSSNLVSGFRAAAAKTDTTSALFAWNAALDKLDPLILRTATTGQQDLVFALIDTSQSGNIKSILGDSASLKYAPLAYSAVRAKIQKMSAAGWAFDKVNAKNTAFASVPTRPVARSGH